VQNTPSPAPASAEWQFRLTRWIGFFLFIPIDYMMMRVMPGAPAAGSTLPNILVPLSVGTAGLSILVRKLAARRQPRKAFIFALVLCEVAALCGVVVWVTAGSPRSDYCLLAGAAGMLLQFPLRSHSAANQQIPHPVSGMEPQSPEGWRPPSELECYLPRPVRLTGAGIAWCLGSVCLTALFAYSAVWIAGDNRRGQAEARRILAASQETEGVVTHLRAADREHRVDYQFTAAGRAFAGHAYIDPRHFEGLKIGGPIAVRYLPSDPADSFLSSKGPLVMRIPPAFAYPVCALGVLAGAVTLLAVWHDRWYLAHGRPASGVVTRVANVGYYRTYFNIYFEFQPCGGGTCQGRYQLTTTTPPHVGSAVCVLYDPDNPRHHVRYPMYPSGFRLLELDTGRRG